MARYAKKTVVVDAYQTDLAGDYGVLGSLVTDDWILHTAAGLLLTLDSANFAIKYTATSDSATLTGTDVL